MPDGYPKVMPLFNWENGISAKNHLTAFEDCNENLSVEDDDVFSGMFAHSIEGEARKWFRNLPHNPIRHWG
jgi:hypothetical protein